MSEDERLIELFQSGNDIYCEVARFAFNDPIEKSNPKRRMYKSIILGVFYGMSEFGLAKALGCSPDEAEEHLYTFFGAFPGVTEWVKHQKRVARKKGYVQTVSGRKVWINPYTSQWERNALNAPIQGSAAEAMKMAATKFVFEKWGSRDGDYQHSPLRLMVHDELVVEVPEKMASLAAQLLEEAMVEVGNELHPGIPSVADVHVGKTWAVKG